MPQAGPRSWRNGRQLGTSRATLSPDLETLTVENEITAAVGGRQPGTATDIRVRT